MALHDVDKSADKRLSPKPNASDDVMNRMAHKTISTTYRSTDLKQRVAFDQSQIQTYDENNVLSSFYGYDPDVAENPVLKIAKPGYDAKTGADADMIFNSQQNTFKIVDTGTIVIPSLTVAAGTVSGIASTVIEHNLGTTPICMGFMVDSYTGSRTQLPSFYLYQGFQTVTTISPATAKLMPLNEWVNIKTTSTTIGFYNNFTNTDHPNFSYISSAITIKYYLLQETSA